jgi:hypothetical protein
MLYDKLMKRNKLYRVDSRVFSSIGCFLKTLPKCLTNTISNCFFHQNQQNTANHRILFSHKSKEKFLFTIELPKTAYLNFNIYDSKKSVRL